MWMGFSYELFLALSFRPRLGRGNSGSYCDNSLPPLETCRQRSRRHGESPDPERPDVALVIFSRRPSLGFRGFSRTSRSGILTGPVRYRTHPRTRRRACWAIATVFRFPHHPTIRAAPALCRKNVTCVGENSALMRVGASGMHFAYRQQRRDRDVLRSGEFSKGAKLLWCGNFHNSPARGEASLVSRQITAICGGDFFGPTV